MNNEVVIDSVTDNNVLFKVKRKIYYAVKRLFDMIISLFGILLLIPFSLVIKICSIISGDFGKIFYSQERIGKNGKIFKLYKFRSMVPNADEVLKELLKDKKIAKEYKKNKKLDNDPRVTKIGKFIRKTSIDELPQAINIFKGEMSLIGNRPYLPREKEDMGEYYDEIIKTKPGLTGYWQCYLRNNGSFEERLKMEEYYSNNIGFKIDIRIFFKTFEVVLFGKGAK